MLSLLKPKQSRIKRKERILHLRKPGLRASYPLLLSGYMRGGLGVRMAFEQVKDFVPFNQGKTKIVSAPVKTVDGET